MPVSMSVPEGSVHWLNADQPLDSLIAQSDEIEIHPLCVEPDFVETCEANRADMWGVFVHLRRGGIRSVADFSHEENALRTMLEKINPSLKST